MGDDKLMAKLERAKRNGAVTNNASIKSLLDKCDKEGKSPKEHQEILMNDEMYKVSYGGVKCFTPGHARFMTDNQIDVITARLT